MKRYLKFLVPIVLVVIIGVFVVGASLDKNHIFGDNPGFEKAPYIEYSSSKEEYILVGSVVQEWMLGERHALDLYDEYRAHTKTYASKSVDIKYAIYNLPYDVTIESQKAELSVNEDFSESREFTLSGESRSVSFNYLLVNTTYYLRISCLLSNDQTVSSVYHFKTATSPRLIELGNLRNIRDIGGWSTVDKKYIKQGMIYRGCELDGAIEPKYKVSDEIAQIMLDELKIKMEMDLRSSQLENTKDMLGSNVKHEYYGFLSYSEAFTDSGKRKLKRIFTDLANPENYPIYMHCSYGADRTGTVCYFLEAILGLSEEDLYREWELSILQNGGAFYEEMDKFVEALKSYEGDTMQEKVENYLLSIGVTAEEIASIRTILLEES